MVQAPPPMPPMPPMEQVVINPPPWVTLPPPVVLLGFVAMCVVAGVVLFPLVRALARRIEGRAVPAEPDPQLLAEVEQLRHRVSELEERLDFAERMLSRRPGAEALPRGGNG